MEPRPPTDPDRPPEHPFGKIHEITVPLKWAPTPAHHRKKARKFVDATSETWSVNGVGFVSKTNAAVNQGGVVTIRIGPARGEAVVRTMQPTQDADLSYYGTELISEELQSVARDLISIHQRHRPEERPPSGSPLDQQDPNQKNVSDWT